MTSGGEDGQWLSDTQRRLAAAAIGMLAVVVIVAFVFAVFMLLRGFVQTFAVVLWPLAVAGVLALMLRPLVEGIERRLRLSRIGAIVLLYGVVVLVFGVILAIVIPVVFEQAVRLVEFIPDLIASTQAWIMQRHPGLGELLRERLGDISVDRVRELLTAHVGQLLDVSRSGLGTLREAVGAVVAAATGVAIIPVYLFFFLETRRDVSADLREQLSFVREEWRDDVLFLIREFVGSIVAFFRGQLVIALIMGMLLALGLSIAGVNFAIVLGLTMGLLNIIPYLGSIIGLATVLPMAYFQPEGGLATTLAAIGVFAAVQVIEGYVLTPKIMGRSTGLHPLAIIIAIFFWGVALGGLLGMILAIPLTAFFVVAWRLAKRKYLG